MELAIAQPLVYGEPLAELPADLFIPPDALAVLLESFSGPLDLLLYLIRKQNIDILDIPIKQITYQYIAYIKAMQASQLTLAADYLLMAATLAEIKSKLLLPQPKLTDEEEDDPRMKLVRQLQLYEQFKLAGVNLDTLPRLERDYFDVSVATPYYEVDKPLPSVSLQALTDAMNCILSRLEKIIPHQISREQMSVRDRMNLVLNRLGSEKVVSFFSLILREEGRVGIVVSFLAMLELSRLSMLDITQLEPFSAIFLEAYHG